MMRALILKRIEILREELLAAVFSLCVPDINQAKTVLSDILCCPKISILYYIALEVKGPSGARLLAGSPSGLFDFILCPLRRDNYRVLSPLVEEGSVLPWQPPALKCFFGIVCTLKLPLK